MRETISNLKLDLRQKDELQEEVVVDDTEEKKELNIFEAMRVAAGWIWVAQRPLQNRYSYRWDVHSVGGSKPGAPVMDARCPHDEHDRN